MSAGVDAVVLRTAQGGYRWALRIDGDVVSVSTDEWPAADGAQTALDVVLEAINWRRAR